VIVVWEIRARRWIASLRTGADWGGAPAPVHARNPGLAWWDEPRLNLYRHPKHTGKRLGGEL